MAALIRNSWDCLSFETFCIFGGPLSHQTHLLATDLEMRLLEDAGQLGRAVVFDLQAADVPQDLRHQLHVVVLHRLQLYLLRLLLSLGVGGGRVSHT